MGISIPTPPAMAPASRLRSGQVARPKRTRALTFGVLVDWLDPYQSAVVGGMLEAGRESAASVLCFVGGTLHAPFRSAERRNVVYDLAGSERIDGLVVVADPIGSYLGLEDLARYCERYRPLPMSSIAATIPGMTSILIDAEKALRDGIKHLVEHHHYTRIAFLGGPPGNLDARLRLKITNEVLGAYGLRPPDTHVVTGDFTYESGVDAMRLLLDERAATFDAVVAANDQMALGAIDALRARDIQVPRSVAILGFDDTPEARFSAPPLTTIRQPLHQQGRLAVEALVRRLRGETVEDVLVLPGELVIRRSCGCSEDGGTTSDDTRTSAGRRPSPALSVHHALQTHRSNILEAMRAPLAGLQLALPDGWAESLLDVLVADLNGTPGSAFADRFKVLLDGVAHTAETSVWQTVLSALSRQLLPCLATDPELLLRAEDRLQEARALASEAVAHEQAQHRLRIDRRGQALSEAAELLSAAFDLESLGKALEVCLPRLGIPSAYLVLADPTSPDGAVVAFSHDPRREAAALEQLREAPVKGRFVPDGLLPDDRPYTMVVAPLFLKDDPFGSAIFELGPLDGLTYEALRGQISSALKVTLLIAELQVRAGELGSAYEALQDNQARLLSSEKMASLGRITANIAHEMNSPLAAVRASLAELDKRATEYQDSIGDDEVTPDDHREIALEMRAAIQLARGASERAAGFVRGIKTQTRDLAGQDKVRFDPVPVIEEALLLLSYDIRRASGGVRFVPPRQPVELLGTPGRLSQIVTNLVTNALDALPEDGPASVTLTLSADANEARLEVQDTGSGIPAGVRARMFEPMFTTKPVGEGTGLGLSIVKDLVDGHFGGHIDVISEPGHGTTFALTFPLAAKD